MTTAISVSLKKFMMKTKVATTKVLTAMIELAAPKPVATITKLAAPSDNTLSMRHHDCSW